ncbi:hypothetical protein, partial [Salmonella sp. s51228]|uniref:hypothetical protein n=1 Tax=Salmonella sp. s51228 TaxID=3159652 RepID=UPI00397F5E43
LSMDGNVPGRSYAGDCYYYSQSDGTAKCTKHFNEVISSNPELVLNKGDIPSNVIKRENFYITIALDEEGMMPGYSNDANYCYYTVPSSSRGRATKTFYWVVEK